MQEEQFNKRISQLQETIASRDKVIVDLKNTILGYVEVVFNYHFQLFQYLMFGSLM